MKCLYEMPWGAGGSVRVHSITSSSNIVSLFHVPNFFLFLDVVLYIAFFTCFIIAIIIFILSEGCPLSFSESPSSSEEPHK